MSAVRTCDSAAELTHGTCMQTSLCTHCTQDRCNARGTQHKRRSTTDCYRRHLAAARDLALALVVRAAGAPVDHVLETEGVEGLQLAPGAAAGAALVGDHGVGGRAALVGGAAGGVVAAAAGRRAVGACAERSAATLEDKGQGLKEGVGLNSNCRPGSFHSQRVRHARDRRQCNRGITSGHRASLWLESGSQQR